MMPMPSAWSLWRAKWHEWWQIAAALTAPPPPRPPDHIQIGAALHCYSIGMVEVISLDTRYGLASVRQPRGNPWTAPYSALTPPSAAELFAYEAEVRRRSRPVRTPGPTGTIIPFPPRPTGAAPSPGGYVNDRS